MRLQQTLIAPLIVFIALSFSCKKESPAEPVKEPEVTEGGPPDIEQWQIVFIDDFSGASLDRTKWDPYYTWGRKGTVERHHNYDAWVLDANTTIENGLLRLKCEPNRDNLHPYTYYTGVVTATSLVCRSGDYVEAKMRMPHGSSDAEYSNGLWPAFWLNGRTTWPPEIDVHEFFGCNTAYQVTMHSSDPNEDGRHLRIAAPEATTAFNIYAVHWRLDAKVDVYFNNELQGTLPEPDPYDDMVLIINFGIHGPKDEQNWLGDASRNTYPQYYDVDWVRVWRKK